MIKKEFDPISTERLCHEVMLAASAAGAMPVFKIFGCRSGTTKQTMTLEVPLDAEFEGIEDYKFDGETKCLKHTK